MSENITRCNGEDDPERCIGVTRHGQCNNKRYPGSQYCLSCSPPNAKQADGLSLKNYNLTRFRARVAKHSNSSEVKSLREDIGILRMLLEERVNMCHDEHDLLMQTPQISDLILKIEKVVASCHRLEQSLGQLLDKQAILQFASTVIGIVSQHVDEDKINIISNQIIAAIGEE